MGEYTVQGILAVLILREVFSFLKDRRQERADKMAGDHTAEFWIASNKDIVMQALQVSVLPILAQQTRILDDLKELASSHTERLLRIQISRDKE